VGHQGYFGRFNPANKDDFLREKKKKIILVSEFCTQPSILLEHFQGLCK
jgi:hypothetical protein